mmetsp:Transcript_20105/g.80198  ORF Transcript_20105/g.80198 Transcript_20105/m.80198 type:complete len:230 (+) Transcript_20105:231-920(+)
MGAAPPRAPSRAVPGWASAFRDLLQPHRSTRVTRKSRPGSTSSTNTNAEEEEPLLPVNNNRRLSTRALGARDNTQVWAPPPPDHHHHRRRKRGRLLLPRSRGRPTRRCRARKSPRGRSSSGISLCGPRGRRATSKRTCDASFRARATSPTFASARKAPASPTSSSSTSTPPCGRTATSRASCSREDSSKSTTPSRRLLPGSPADPVVVVPRGGCTLVTAPLAGEDPPQF